MSGSDSRPEAELDEGTAAEQDRAGAAVAPGTGVERVRDLLLGDELSEIDRRLTLLEARFDIEIAQVRSSVVRSTQLLLEVLRQEIRDLASRVEAGIPKHSRELERLRDLASRSGDGDAEA